MKADLHWFKTNLGYDFLNDELPTAAYAFEPAKGSGDSEDLAREIIDFDSEGPSGLQFFAFSTATGLSRYKDIQWPAGKEPRTAATAGGTADEPLPKADVLVVTWTVDEGHALSRVLTPGKDSRNDYQSYTHNFETLSKKFRRGSPALEAKRLGAYWMTTIAGRSVVVFKSDSHLSQDGPEVPNIDVWRQIVQEVGPRLVITTGTAGGIGTDAQVGDVCVSAEVRFDCTSKFKAQPFHDGAYASRAANAAGLLNDAQDLFKYNSEMLPRTNTRPPLVTVNPPEALTNCVVTTDFFGFDTSNDHYKLQGLGLVSEMGDAVLGLVTEEMGEAAPAWLAIRNVSDPQIAASDLTLKQQGDMAAQIYKAYGRWSSVCSAITCWAYIAVA